MEIGPAGFELLQPVQHLAVKRLGFGDHQVAGELALEFFSSLLAHALAARRVANQGVESAGQSRGVTGRNEKAGVFVGDFFGHAVHAAGDDGKPGAHRFHDRDRQAFVVRGQDEGLRGAQQSGHIVPVAQKRDAVLKAQFARQPLELVEERAGADQIDVKIARLAVAFQKSEGAQKRRLVFLFAKARHHHEARRLCCGARLRGVGRDAVVDCDEGCGTSHVLLQGELPVAFTHANDARAQRRQGRFDGPRQGAARARRAGTKAPTVRREHDGHARSMSRQSHNCARFAGMRVNQVGTHAPDERGAFAHRRQIDQGVDRALQARQKMNCDTQLARVRSERPLDTGRQMHFGALAEPRQRAVGIVEVVGVRSRSGEPFEQIGDVRLRSAQFGFGDDVENARHDSSAEFGARNVECGMGVGGRARMF